MADDYSDFTVAQTDAESAPLEGSGEYAGFLPEAARANGYATTFADQNDLLAYQQAKAAGT